MEPSTSDRPGRLQPPARIRSSPIPASIESASPVATPQRAGARKNEKPGSRISRRNPGTYGPKPSSSVPIATTASARVARSDRPRLPIAPSARSSGTSPI
jgi:hypothetical protein